MDILHEWRVSSSDTDISHICSQSTCKQWNHRWQIDSIRNSFIILTLLSPHTSHCDEYTNLLNFSRNAEVECLLDQPSEKRAAVKKDTSSRGNKIPLMTYLLSSQTQWRSLGSGCKWTRLIPSRIHLSSNYLSKSRMSFLPRITASLLVQHLLSLSSLEWRRYRRRFVTLK